MSIFDKLSKFSLKLPTALAKAGRTMSECPLELSFSLCDDNSSNRSKTEEQIPLQVKLPCDSGEQDVLLINKEALEKAEEETSEKQDNMEITCSVHVDGQEKQEFSFTLYDFDTCDRANKQDLEKVVVRSICDALNKTLKLPPSGSRTVKVELAISPDSSKDIDTKESPAETEDWPTESSPPKKPLPSKLNDCCSAQSANTTSTYLNSSYTEKPPKFASPILHRSPVSPILQRSPASPILHRSPASPILQRSPQMLQRSPPSVRAMPSPKLKSSRQNRPVRTDQKNHLRERLLSRLHASDNRHHIEDNSPNFDDLAQPSSKPSNSRDHVPECRDRRNHYLDLAGIESPKRNNLSQHNHANETAQHHSAPTREDSHLHDIPVDPNYLYRLLDRSYQNSKSHRTKEYVGSPLKKPSNYHSKLNDGSPGMYRTKLNLESQDELLNFDYDLNDLVPEAKFDWQKPAHRRSKSYDLYENNVMNPGGFYSPKLKPKNNNWASLLESQKLSNHSSPGHQQYRHRNRDRERQRAMQQVASWIAREHTNSKVDAAKHFVRSSIAPGSPAKQLVERHEHHHRHEHIHHHYHHFVEF